MEGLIVNQVMARIYVNTGCLLLAWLRPEYFKHLEKWAYHSKPIAAQADPKLGPKMVLVRDHDTFHPRGDELDCGLLYNPSRSLTAIILVSGVSFQG
jgi:hypothetical protein